MIGKVAINDYLIVEQHIIAVEKRSEEMFTIYLTGGHKLEVQGKDALKLWENWKKPLHTIDAQSNSDTEQSSDPIY